MKIMSRELITDITETREGTNELVHRLIVERVTFDEAGEVPSKPGGGLLCNVSHRLYGCPSRDVKCPNCPNNEMVIYANQGLVTLTPTDDPLTWVMTAEYRE